MEDTTALRFHYKDATVVFSRTEDGVSEIALAGQLTAFTIGSVWRKIDAHIEEVLPPVIRINAVGVPYCDGNGVGLLVDIIKRQVSSGRTYEITGLSASSRGLLEYYLKDLSFEIPQKRERESFFECLGRSVISIKDDIVRLITFSGELSCSLFSAVANPSDFRWKDVVYYIEVGGINAIPIVAVLSFLMGLIMAFQAAIPMKQFGADMYVADLVALALLRELGPLMTAIVLAGRSGSAFAAEIGTMKVNEELNALHTMGLNPIGFLVINRVLATLILMPVLVLIADVTGLVGGAVVFRSLGYPLITYINQVLTAISLGDFVGGFVKSFVFAILISAIGCLRGMETSSGSSAVGQAATSAMVSGLTLIVITDGVFSLVYYYLGI